MHNRNKLSPRQVVVYAGLAVSMIGALLSGCAVRENGNNSAEATATKKPESTLPILPEPLPTATEESVIMPTEICHQVLTTYEYYQLMNDGADIDPLGAYSVYDRKKVSQLGILSGKKIINGYPDSDYPFIAEQEAAGTGLQVCYTKMPDGSISKYPGTASVPYHHKNTANVVTTPRNQFAGLKASNRAISSKPSRF